MLMYRIKTQIHKKKQCCPSCSKKDFINEKCPVCGGKGVRNKSVYRFEVMKEPCQVGKIDRSPINGKLRYWTSASEYFYEETYPTDNHYVPDIPNGVHFLHHSLKDAERECDRINKILEERGL